jgi:rod shape determining protein RodA
MDWTLFFLTVFMVSFGLLIQYALSLGQSFAASTFYRQLLFFGVGLVVFFLVAFSDFRFIKSLSYPFYFFSLFLLVLVLIKGETLRGAQGWFVFSHFSFQPSELAKLAAIILLAKFWESGQKIFPFVRLLFSFAVALPAFFLILLQNDLGSALIIGIISIGLSLMADRNPRHILYLLLGLAVIICSSWFLLKDYQKDRIINYMHPQKDLLGTGYQTNQSLIAIGSGGLFGRGLGLGSQSQTRLLPEVETDFTFAALSEDFGFLGSFLFLFFDLFFLLRLIHLSRKVYDNYSLVLIVGVALYFFSQITINVGMNLGLFPVVGIPLPFLSYGGSSLLVSLLPSGWLKESSCTNHLFRFNAWKKTNLLTLSDQNPKLSLVITA